ncbi:MAG TPA: CsbD family protein [Gemmatimonadales bacterium]|nr:CsbD family protein [Gemmatimonadales bacterium]
MRETRTVEADMADGDLTRRGIDNSLEGKGNDLKGKVKDAIGGLTGDTSLQAEGKLDQLKGKVQDTVGGVQRDLDRPKRDDL